jgi:hypothetical protein
MQRLGWRSIYWLIGTGLAAAIGLLGCSIATNSQPLAFTGFAICIIALVGARLVTDARWLKTRRAQLDADRAAVTDDQKRLYADRAVLENQGQRARREMDDEERSNRESLRADRKKLRAEIAAEREAMLIEVENEQDKYKREGFEVGLEMGLRGVGPEAKTNVIRLPLSPHQSTTMGQGAFYN